MRRPRYRLPPGKTEIRFFDGFLLRYMNPDFDICLWREKESVPSSRFIPKNEIWIDWRYKKEAQFLIDVMRIEAAPRFRKSPYSRIRAELKRRLCLPGPIPDFFVREQRRGELKIKYVRGEVIRRYVDPAFIFGGHDLVYGYIPKNEVWIDLTQDQREIPFTIMHELRERELMARRGLTYSEAHARAISHELVHRARRLTLDLNAPLPLIPFRQSAGLCGPASLKIALGYFGIHMPERKLAKLCRATPQYGTDHVHLMAAARRLGATVTAKEGGTVQELREIVHTERLPVIVGWYSPTDPRRPQPDEDHFSVVAQVTDRKILLLDPEKEDGITELSISRFEKLWWDTDESAGGGRVNRWFMKIEI